MAETENKTNPAIVILVVLLLISFFIIGGMRAYSTGKDDGLEQARIEYQQEIGELEVKIMNLERVRGIPEYVDSDIQEAEMIKGITDWLSQADKIQLDIHGDSETGQGSINLYLEFND